MTKGSLISNYLVLASLALVADPSQAGVYLGTARCSMSEDCEPGVFASDPSSPVPPFAVAHPPTYDGTGGVLSLRVCVLEGSERLRGPVQRAVATWNALEPTTENCTACKVWEDLPPSTDVFHAETTALHELGHCPLGLEHPDRNWDAAGDGIWEFTSFTRSWGVASPELGGIQVGPDFVRGTLDDVQQAGGGQLPESVHWFRRADNDPFAIDGSVIDVDTFTRSAVALPDGHGWAANANRRVGEELGITDTQSVMYALQSPGEIKTSLTADDVNMVKMGMTGINWTASDSDDYSIDLQFVDTCDSADVLVSFGEVTVIDALAECAVGVDFSFQQNPMLARHVTVVSPTPSEPLVIIFDQTLQWATGDCPDDPLDTGCLFTGGFESGDASRWDLVSR